MKVYYSSNLRSKDKGLWGWSQKTNWEFEYGATKHYIPAIYRFSKGIVFDVITILDERKLQKFFEKYEAIEEKLTPLQIRCVEQEHPYQAVPISGIWINGRPVEDGYSSSGSISIPWIHQGDKLTVIKNAYSSILKDISCFAYKRFCVPYPPATSRFQKLLRVLKMDKVNSIKLLTYPVERFLPLDIHFEMSISQKMKQLSFNHPITGVEHILYFQGVESVSLPLGVGEEHTLYIMRSMYEIKPELPQGDTLQFNSSTQYIEPPQVSDKEYIPASASSIGVIGGADGPTSIFISSEGEDKSVPRGINCLPLHSCYSVPSFQQEKTWNFFLEGINTKDRDSMEYNFQL